MSFLGRGEETFSEEKEDTILDPACGTAGFLISAYKHILRENGVRVPGDQLTPDQRTKLMTHFIGYDISPDMVRLSLVNMYLHSFPNPRIYEYDTLTSEERWNETYDVIMANPPFMSPKGGIRPHKRFSIQANRSEVLFVDYIAEHLTIHGRAGVIVPEGIIFQSGTAYKALRKMLVEKYLYAVVSLSSGVFQPYSGVKTTILLMDKNLAKKVDSVLFVKVENDGFDLGAQRRPIDKNDLTQALAILQQYKQAFQEGKDTIELLSDAPLSHIAVLAEKAAIAKSGEYNLSGERYKVSKQRTNPKWPLIDLEQVCVKITDGSHFSPKTTDSGYPYITVKDIKDDTIDFENCKYIDELSYKSLVQTGCKPIKGDVLFSKDGTVGKVSIIDYEKNFVVLSSLAILRPNPEKILSLYLKYLLKDQLTLEQALGLKTGSALKRIILENIKKIQIPLPPLSVQQEIVAELENYQKIIDGARQVVENYRPTIKVDPFWETIKLGEISEFRNGINYTKESNGEKIKIAGVKDFQDNFHMPTVDLEYIVADRQLSEKDLLKENNLIFVRSNGNQNLIGRCLLVGKVDERITHSGFTIRLILKSNKLDPVFLTHLLKLDTFRKNMIEGGTGANIKSLNQGTLSSLLIPLPTIEMQKQIVAQIEEELKLVEANEKLIEIFEQKIKDKIAEVWGDITVELQQADLVAIS